MTEDFQTQGILTIPELQRLYDYNVPYYGIVDNGEGVSMLINSNIDSHFSTVDNVTYFNKKIEIQISKVRYTVKKGDSLSALSKQFGVSVAEIAAKNGIANVNLIRVGKILNMEVDIQYGYEVKSMIDANCFTPKAREQGYEPMSESMLYRILDKTNAIVDNFGGTLKDNAGKSRASALGRNFKVYMEKPTGRVFWGNQYVKTYALKDVGNSITKYTRFPVGRIITPVAVLFEGVEIIDGIAQDGGTFGYHAKKETVGAAYGIIGGTACAMIGAKFGFAVGLLFGGWGAIPGAMIGGFIGGFFGSELSENGAEALYDYLSKYNIDGNKD